MLTAGLDIGSRTIKIVILDTETDEIVVSRKTETTYDPIAQARRLLDGLEWNRLVGTGYGRKLVTSRLDGDAITEIQAHALGARRRFPEAGAVLDIGGQDTKAIALDSDGRVKKFEMNDRCAAGTGKFLEFMATSFQIPIEEFGRYALEGSPGLSISSMCTVFAETEATSLMARGHPPQDIALALHLSVAKRSLSMLKRVSPAKSLVFSGGVALNPCAVGLMADLGHYDLTVPPEPDMIGALGAAVYGAKS